MFIAMHYTVFDFECGSTEGLCPTIESTTPTEATKATEATETTTMTTTMATEIKCPSEVDKTWLIDWPPTAAGSQAVTRCRGLDSIG